MRIVFALFVISNFLFSCTPSQSEKAAIEAPQWEEIELVFTAANTYNNPYTDAEMYAEFIGPEGQKLRRPAFWDGGQNWKVRFASPVAQGEWKWHTLASDSSDTGLHGQEGRLKSVAYTGNNQLLRHGLLRMSEGKRNVVHADGTPFIVVGDTPWAMPWRSTYENTAHYAQDRGEKGFNTALLMTIQPDKGATGPNARDTDQGFAVAFSDLMEGHINHINADYFQYMDSLMSILVANEIVPVYQPVFHGYGWKGQEVLGKNVNPVEYARYCKYLVARYGARPAMWLVGADGMGREVGVKEGGETVEAWDAYQQPTGIHYNPFDDFIPNWADPETYKVHYNKAYQAADWLDFQWAQTGHTAKRIYDKVELMYENKPTKAVANGEPTYEGIRDPENGAGWWQGEEAWMQLMSGGTMGVVYGAGGIWQWKVSGDEAGWPEWANSEVSWKEALDLEGSRYVGYLAKALEGMPFTDMEKRKDLAGGKPCLAKSGEFYVSYLKKGGDITLSELTPEMPYQWFNPKTGAFLEEAKVTGTIQTFTAPDKEPWVLLVGKRKTI
ncbi:DUF4038 domain-containing protein [Cyclobacterium sp. 1_MG-2023]|uniref:apiosidase-like domain-containing protein n=1 Tax=Cyclobacterium sp. 1_MG-2023 TaxID=3062681 RepID=UPI0026E2FF19|nr:DUF4038 domain-containing protein [Cyclobacterium sp. 1_MG-2023]MDO6436087.1 DUF4038 domain-containing protein [Cyclobacterium sp. 1_MG-2023]